jgi:hypothetical protein
MAALLAFLPAPAGHAQTLIFRDARVFTGDRVLENTDVLVRDDRIAEVGIDITAPADAATIDASGRTLLPGLIDAHTHSFGDALTDALIFGVTTSLDMFTDAAMMRTFRTQQDGGGAPDRRTCSRPVRWSLHRAVMARSSACRFPRSPVLTPRRRSWMPASPRARTGSRSSTTTVRCSA